MLIALLIFAVVFITFLLFIIIYIYPSVNRDTTIPGPPPSTTSEGNLADAEMAGGLGEYLRELHEQYGPLVSLHLGRQLVVSLGTPELIAQHTAATWRPDLYLDFLRPLLGRDSLVWAEPAETARRWRLYRQGFSDECRQVYRRQAREAAGRVVEKLTSLPPGEHVSLQQYTSALALHIVTRCCFSHHMDDESNMLSFAQEYEIVTAEVSSEACGRLLYGGQQDHLLEAAAALRDIVSAVIKKHRRAGKATVSLVEWVSLAAPGASSVGDIEYQVTDLLALFTFLCETLASGLCWTLFYLSKHQTVQDAVTAELLELPDSDQQPDLTKLSQSVGVLKEAWRLGCVVPYTARMYTSPVAVEGHAVPARTPIFSSYCAANLAQDSWRNATKFDPGRHSSAEEGPDMNPLPFLGPEDDVDGVTSMYCELVLEVLRTVLPSVQLQLLPENSAEQMMTFVTTPRENVWVAVSPRSAD